VRAKICLLVLGKLMTASKTAETDKQSSYIPGTGARKAYCATSTLASRSGFFGPHLNKPENGIGTLVNAKALLPAFLSDQAAFSNLTRSQHIRDAAMHSTASVSIKISGRS